MISSKCYPSYVRANTQIIDIIKTLLHIHLSSRNWHTFQSTNKDHPTFIFWGKKSKSLIPSKCCHTYIYYIEFGTYYTSHTNIIKQHLQQYLRMLNLETLWLNTSVFDKFKNILIFYFLKMLERLCLGTVFSN